MTLGHRIALALGALLLILIPAMESAAQVNKSDTFSQVIAPARPQNTRNSEAAITQLSDGRLLLGWTEFYSGDGADHGPARLVGRISEDRGKTWGEKYTLVENDGGCNVMEVNFLRLNSGNLAIFYCQKNSESTDCRVMMRSSSDDGLTFGPAKQMSPEGKYTGLTNGRCIRLASGRILLEAWEGGDAYCCISDDDGETWRDGARVKPEDGKCFEPACVELRDGSVMMLMRTHLGSQYKSFSQDGGETWSVPVPTDLKGTPAPVSISRVPSTGHLLAIWNHDPNKGRRHQLTAAISGDEGETWGLFRNLETRDDDGMGWAYPAVTWVGEQALITYFSYGGGGISLHLRSLPAGWFYD